MTYKLLILDVDDVLVKSKDAPVSAIVIKAIKSLNGKVVVTLCTGRTKKDVQRVVDVLVLQQNYHVIESGAKVLNPKGQEEHIKGVSLSDIQWIIDSAEHTPAGYGYCVNGTWVDDVSSMGDGLVTTVSLHSRSQKQTKEILEKIKPVSERYNVAVGSHWQIPEGNFILITHREATKGSAISYIQSKLGIPKEETIGVGDMPNDLPIFEQSGVKVAFGNADDELKRSADIVAPSIDDDGVAYVIKKYLIENRTSV